MQRIYLLKGKLQSYSWGGYHYLPQLLDFSGEEGKSYAEYWMGAHPSHSSSVVVADKELPVIDLIKADKNEALGAAIAGKFDSLPYLFKVLDVRQMLSIQVHPSKEEAAKGFENEQNNNVPITAPHRNYKDKNHKPEMMVALSPFWLLHGFKGGSELLKIFDTVSELNFLAPVFKQGDYKNLFAYVMNMEQHEVDRLLLPLRDRIVPLYNQQELQKDTEDFWAARAFSTFCPKPPFDRGIFCVYLFNLLHLQKGEGIYQPSGMPHAYLEGQNVELMANSDNVLRAGLTDKHIDVAELLKHTICEATIPNVLRSAGEEATLFPSPAKEFALWQINLDKEGKWITSESAEILLVLEGNLNISTGEERLSLKKGETAFLLANTSVMLHPEPRATVFRATVGSV